MFNSWNWELIVSSIAIIISIVSLGYTYRSNKKNARFVLFSQIAEIRNHINLLNIEWEKFRLEWILLEKIKDRGEGTESQYKYDALTAALDSLEIAMLNHYEHIAIIMITFDKEEVKYAYDVYAEELKMVLEDNNFKRHMSQAGYPYLLKIEKIFEQLETEQLDKRSKEFVKITVKRNILSKILFWFK